MADNEFNWISVGSFLFSGIALLVSISANRKANAIKQRQLEIEEQREEDRKKQKRSALLRSELRKVREHYRLCLINHGAVEARNVRIIMDGKLLSEHAASIQDDKLPELIGGNSEVSCFLSLGPGRMPPFKVEVRWDDDSGTENKSFNTLTLPSK